MPANILSYNEKIFILDSVSKKKSILITLFSVKFLITFLFSSFQEAFHHNQTTFSHQAPNHLLICKIAISKASNFFLVNHHRKFFFSSCKVLLFSFLFVLFIFHILFRRSGLLSLGHQQQQLQNSQQQQQQQQQRGVIGQIPMQGHSSPSNSPGLIIGNKIGMNQTSRTIGLPPSSMGLGSSTPPLSNGNFPGFIGGQINRNSLSSNSSFGQVIF